MNDKKSDPISLRVLQRIQQGQNPMVWTPGDFFDLGNYEIIKKSLQRLVKNKTLRRIDRGLYDQLRINPLTGKFAPPDYRMVIDAISRRDQARLLIDGLTAANDLNLTNAVPAKVIVHTDARLRAIHIDKLTIQFKLTSPSKLYWAGRPAMHLIQALYWLRDSLKSGSLIDEHLIQTKIQLLLTPTQGNVILADLKQGFHTLPSWMQDWIISLLKKAKIDLLKE